MCKIPASGRNLYIVCLLYSTSLSVIVLTIVLVFKPVAYLNYMDISLSACSETQHRLYFPCDFTVKTVARHIVPNQLAFISHCRVSFFFVFFFFLLIRFPSKLLYQSRWHFSYTLFPAHFISVLFVQSN